MQRDNSDPTVGAAGQGADEDAVDGPSLVPVPWPGHDAATVMDLLAEHVPLALLADRVAPGGPESHRILEDEGLPDDAWWEAADAGPAAAPAKPEDPAARPQE